MAIHCTVFSTLLQGGRVAVRGKRWPEQTGRNQGRHGSPSQLWTTFQSQWKSRDLAGRLTINTGNLQLSAHLGQSHHLGARCGCSRQIPSPLISKELSIMPRVAFRGSGLRNAEWSSVGRCSRGQTGLTPAGTDMSACCWLRSPKAQGRVRAH